MRAKVPRFARAWLLIALLLSIPAFYLALLSIHRSVSTLLYLLAGPGPMLYAAIGLSLGGFALAWPRSP